MPTGGRRREAARAPQLLCIDASSCWRSQLGAGRGVLPLKHGRARSGAVSSSRVSAATSAVLDDGAALRSGAAVPPSRSGLGLTAPTGSPQPSAPSPQRPKRLGRLVRHRRSGEERFFFPGRRSSGRSCEGVGAGRRRPQRSLERARRGLSAGRAQISSPEIPRKRPRRAGRCEGGRRLPPQEGHVRRSGRRAPPAPAPPPRRRRRRARTAIKGAAALPDTRPALAAAAATRSPARPPRRR